MDSAAKNTSICTKLNFKNHNLSGNWYVGSQNGFKGALEGLRTAPNTIFGLDDGF